MNKTKNFGFTLIEILVVATIIGMLAAVAAVSYSSFTKSSRDARRKADMEQIRAALEMYRSNSVNGQYPAAAAVSFTCPGNSPLSDGTNTYLTKIPNDPRCAAPTSYRYYYNPGAGLTDYSLGTTLENSTANSACGNNCGGACRYCMGPYGEK